MNSSTKTLVAAVLIRQVKKIDPTLTVNISNDYAGKFLTGCSGSIGNGSNAWVYVCVDHTDGVNGYMTYRTARHATDFVGGPTYYCEAADLARIAVQLLQLG